MIEVFDCTLQLDNDRGVIYVHSPKGFTVLRICGLPKPMPQPTPSSMLDITLIGEKPRFSWGNKKKASKRG